MHFKSIPFSAHHVHYPRVSDHKFLYRAQPVEVEVLLDKQVRMIACGAEHMACTVVHGWVPDEEAKECMACKKSFTHIRRRVCSFSLTHTHTITKSMDFLHTLYSITVVNVEDCIAVLVLLRDFLCLTEATVNQSVCVSDATEYSLERPNTNNYMYSLDCW